MHDPQLCTLRELRDGTYSVDDLYDMHEVMDEREEYTRRHRESAERRAKDVSNG